ncbi:MAG: Spy/CpxP family protein refolding chaperone [Verrucomicrobia bacterium]|nr:Spy/CpxP family protein refolding chaperone [Verrucomicrobiota bacterium]
MKTSVLKMLALGCALALVAPSFALGGDKGAGGKRDGGLGHVEEALAKLELTTQQKTKIEDCKTKFRDYLRACHEEAKAAKQDNDPAKKRQAAKGLAEKRQELTDGIRAVLTDEQKKTFDEAMPKPAARGKGRAKANPKAGGTVTQ